MEDAKYIIYVFVDGRAGTRRFILTEHDQAEAACLVNRLGRPDMQRPTKTNSRVPGWAGREPGLVVNEALFPSPPILVILPPLNFDFHNQSTFQHFSRRRILFCTERIHLSHTFSSTH